MQTQKTHFFRIRMEQKDHLVSKKSANPLQCITEKECICSQVDTKFNYFLFDPNLNLNRRSHLFICILFYLIMTRACVLLSILLANSRAWPHRPPFIAASRASCLIRNKDSELKLASENKTSCEYCYNDIHKNSFFSPFSCQTAAAP